MADLDDFTAAVIKAANDAGLECKPERMMVTFVIGEPGCEAKAMAMQPSFQHSLSNSLAAVQALPAEAQASFIAEGLAPIIREYARWQTGDRPF
jgi:hypothetical protein